MGFAVIGPNRFLGSGHPDGRDSLPPLLGLISSSDAGESWRPVSPGGQRWRPIGAPAAGLLAWSRAGLFLVGGDGATWRADSAGAR
jgi:hypothetical protein